MGSTWEAEGILENKMGYPWALFTKVGPTLYHRKLGLIIFPTTKIFDLENSLIK